MAGRWSKCFWNNDLYLLFLQVSILMVVYPVLSNYLFIFPSCIYGKEVWANPRKICIWNLVKKKILDFMNMDRSVEQE